MFCHKCGKELLTDAKFCNNCDEKINKAQQIDKKKEPTVILDKIEQKNPPKILFFENDDSLANLYGLGIEKYGYHIVNYPHPPKDKKALINLVLTERPEIILTGIILPEMDGYKLTEILKADNRTKNIPIFALTNMDKKEDIEKGIELGMNDYFIRKKFTPQDIVEKFEVIFGETIENKIKLEDVSVEKKKKISPYNYLIGFCFGLSLSWIIGGGLIPFIICVLVGARFTRKMLNPKKISLKIIYWILFVLLFIIGAIINGERAFKNISNNQSDQEYSKINYDIDTQKSEEQKDWTTIKISNIGSISYPDDVLEIQSGIYKKFADEAKKIWEINTTNNIVLQQKGVNEFSESSLDDYTRLIFDAVESNDEILPNIYQNPEFSHDELLEYQKILEEEAITTMKQLDKTTGGNHKFIESISTTIEEINNMYPIVYTFKRQLNDNPIVLVKMYMFIKHNKIYVITISYRLEDEDKYSKLYDGILNTLIIN